MNWINLKISAMNSQEPAGATSAELGTWLRLALYCVEQENGGTIKGARDWSPRQWMAIIGVSEEEIDAETPLWKWEALNLVIWNYPADHQERVERLREIGGRRAKGKPKPTSEAEGGAEGGACAIPEGGAEGGAQGGPKSNSKANSNSKSKGKGNSNDKVKVESEAEAEAEDAIPADATADPADAHSALRAVADLGVEYFLDLKANPTYKALDLQLEAGKANAWAVANRRKFTKRFFVNWLNRGLDRAAQVNADANLHSAKHPKYGW